MIANEQKMEPNENFGMTKHTHEIECYNFNMTQFILNYQVFNSQFSYVKVYIITEQMQPNYYCELCGPKYSNPQKLSCPF